MSTKIVVVAVPILLAAGFFAGRELRPSAVQSDTAGSDHDAVVARLQAENERLRHRVEEIDRAPRLAGVPAAAAPLAGASAPGGPATVANEPVSMTFSLTDYDSPEDAVAHFLRYAAAMFARGEKGHLALLRTLNSFSDRKQREQFERLFGDEESAVASMYPVMRFAVEHESEVAGLTETFFKTMAEDPAFFEKADSDLVEFFGEGVALVLPAVANKEQLARMRGYVQTILALSDDELPSSLRSSRRRLMAALRAWTPSLSSEEIRARLAQGDLEPEEAQVLLERLPAEELGRLDLVALLGPRVRQGDTKALNLVRKAVARDPGRTATWDRVLLQGPPAGTDASRWSWLLRSWLGATDRLPWEKARPFMEAGIDQGGRTAEAFAMALLVLPSRPDPEWVAWMLGRADLPEGVKTLVRSRLAKK